jgi:hypothetical protein
MNAQRRLEEFILKLSIREDEHGQFDNINKLQNELYCKKMSRRGHKSDEKSEYKSSCHGDK